MVVVRLMWWLGNQMFQYALGRHISLKNNEKLYLDLSGLFFAKEKKTTQRDCDLFQFSIDAQILQKNHVDFAYTIPSLFSFHLKKLLNLYPYHIVQERGLRDIVIDKLWKYSGRFNFHSSILSQKKNSYLIWFWQSFKYFEDIRDTLLKDFEPIQVLNKKNADFLTSVIHKTTVSIHIRRWDYDDTYHGFCPLEYYQNAIEYMIKKFGTVHFVVFSNDIARCKKHLDISNSTYIDWNTGADSYQDIVLMSRCNHNIVANSSFSWRGAWLNQHSDKIIIAPKSRFKVALDTSDLIPKDWIRI